jgi:G:T/U-mismatch repair DNA glycosylase
VTETDTPYRKPSRVDRCARDPARLAEMPVLEELRRLPWEARTVPDLLRPGLAVVFVGLNPGRASATAGHHFAGPNNHFWRLLHESGLTPRRLDPAEDEALLAMGIGITNAVSRASRGEQELRWEELLAGAEALRAKVARLRPRLLAVLGKQAYRAYARLPRSADVPWGLQMRQTVSGVAEYLAANPSSRSTLPFAVRLAQFAEIRRLAR